MFNAVSKFLGRCFWVLLSLLITLAIFFGITYVYLELQLPDVKVLNDVHMQAPLRIYSEDGKLIGQYGSIRRHPVTLDHIPPLLVKAVLATEDARYYDHPGVDLISIARAAHAVIRSGRKVQGASTITMQVARNFFLTRKKTYGRKIKEILLALKIDKELSKDKVLELYLNKVYFGKQAYGVAAAAQVYYGKPLSQLTLAEMAMIAGLPQAPSRNNPLNRPNQALKRRNHVLSRMKEVGFINQTDYEKAVQMPLTAKYHGPQVGVNAPYFAEMVRQVVLANYGESVYDKGLAIYTTLSSQLQQEATHSLQMGLIAYSKRHGFHHAEQNLGTPTQETLPEWQKTLAILPSYGPLQPAAVTDEQTDSINVLLANGVIVPISWSGLQWARPAEGQGYVGQAPQSAADIVKPGDVVWVMQQDSGAWSLAQLPTAQGALIALNPQNGAILALNGGFDYDLSNFNRATQAQRQPGSTFKPFIYSAALDKQFTLASLINDAPIVMSDSGENAIWRPRNDTKQFYGPTRLKVGLAKSRNLVSIRLLQAIGVDYAIDYIKRFGFDPDKLPHTLSLALGSATVTPMQIASGYAIFANGGYQVAPYFIQQIKDEKGKIIYQANPNTACRDCTNKANRAISPQTAYLMYDALESVIQSGTGKDAQVLKRNDLAGKTGTTNDQADAWFVGFNTRLLTAVWIGNDDLQSIHEYGDQAALPIWIHFMRNALNGVPESAMPEPNGIVTARIDAQSGLLATPNDADTLFEHFRQGNAPTAYSSTKHFAQQAQQPTTNASSQPSTNMDNNGGADEPIF